LFCDKNSKELSQLHPSGGLRLGRVLAGGREWEVTSECKERTQNQSSVLERGAMFASARDGSGTVTAVQDWMFRAGHRRTAHPRRVISGNNFLPRKRAIRAKSSTTDKHR